MKRYIAEEEEVSVPLRGYGFEITGFEPATHGLEIVSVPLRGYGFEIKLGRGESLHRRQGFRPLAGIWF